jgi:hypothetical protein
MKEKKGILTAFLITLAMLIFSIQSFAAQITFTWNPNSESNLAGYKIYRGLSSGNYSWNVDVENVTLYTITGLEVDVTYYFAATAYNTGGLESGFSTNEVVYTAPACSYSISPTNASFSAFGGSGTITVTTQSDCSWLASSGVSWIAITSGSSGTGSGTVGYLISPNAGKSRSAVSTIAGQLFTFNQSDTFPVYRFRSLVTLGAYFYTIYESEKNSVVANNSRTLVLEGVAFYAYQTQQPGTYPVYRFRSLVTSGAYLYTIYESEKNSIVANNSRTLVLEGVAFYAYQTQQLGTYPVYRFRSLVTSGAYLYTIYESEKNSIVANNSRTLVLEGVGFYARQTP